jgi:hypothetical protein
MPFERRGVALEPAFTNSAHQIKASARSVVFIAGDYVSRTCFEAKPAVNASEKFVSFVGKRVGKQTAHGSVHEVQARV